MQRKRHINFKLHSIPILLNMKKSTSRNSSLNSINNCNYEKNNVKSNVLYSIPCGCAFALLLVGIGPIIHQSSAYAWTAPGSAPDSSTISPVSGGSTTPATASLSLSNPNMTSSAITPGSTATVSTNVTVSVDNAESYSLSLKVDNANLINGSTTIVPGNVTNDNTWGYKWDNATSYTAPSTTGATLTNSTLIPLDSNGTVSFTKDLTFGAKFATNAEAGHYRGSGTLSLVAAPKAATLITLADLTQMQQLAEGYAPDACKNTTIPAGQDYAGPYTLTDVRDNNTYTVYKFKDGKCWMTENLKLNNQVGSIFYGDGRSLNPDTSDVAEDWTLPASSTSGFSSDTASNAYLSGNTGYYTWCAATAGTCSSATSDGDNASSSICPKGWKLPAGRVIGNNPANDFYNVLYNMNLSVKDNLSASSTKSTSWDSSDLAIAQGSPYNFNYTGFMLDGSGPQYTSNGCWWSRTAINSTSAYALGIYSNNTSPGTNVIPRHYGLAIRCVA